MFYEEIAVSIDEIDVVTRAIDSAVSPRVDDSYETPCDTCENPPLRL